MSNQDDWFLPAIEADGSVANCLTVVCRRESSLYFVKDLRAALCTQYLGASDGISHLRQELNSFRKTCDLRLGILAKARPEAWFRDISTAEWGPFPGRVETKAVFINIPPEKAKKLRNEILEAWEQRSLAVPSLPEGDCLWRDLLSLNLRWVEICQLKEPYKDLRLDELPEGLPDDLDSPSLIAFLTKVRAAVDLLRSELDRCFQDVFGASERFLLAYYRPRAGAGQRQKRQSARSPTAQDRVLERSLHFMSFSHTPNLQVLRKRYLELAKSCHPDISGGDDSRFKDLNFHYQRILRAIQMP